MIKTRDERIKIGSLVQINPEIYPSYAGEFCIVTEIKNFGIQGYLALVKEYPHLNRFKGIPYCRFKWETIKYIGDVEWREKRDWEESSD